MRGIIISTRAIGIHSGHSPAHTGLLCDGDLFSDWNIDYCAALVEYIPPITIDGFLLAVVGVIEFPGHNVFTIIVYAIAVVVFIFAEFKLGGL